MDELNAIRWRHQRTARTTKSQAEAVVAYLEKLRTHPGALSEADVATMIDWWRASGLAVGTIQRRLTVLRTMLKHMGLPMPAVHLKPERKLKWWLRPEEQRRVIAYCGPPSEVGTGLFARYVGFVCHSGVRVEEALRIERRPGGR
jgi:site-specific recombinase XerC